jgi:hypothetical protein
MHADYLLLYCNEHATTQMMNEDEKGLCYSAMICMHAWSMEPCMYTVTRKCTVEVTTTILMLRATHQLCVCVCARWYRGAVVPEVNTGPHQIDVGRI